MRGIEKIHFEGGLSGFSGAASGFDEPEFTHGEDAIGGVGLSVGAVQSVARRQLIGSIVVALLIAAVAGTAALKPIYSVATTAPAHGFAVIQQPTFVTLPDQRIAATKRKIEVP
jgi:hypothetical protein